MSTPGIRRQRRNGFALGIVVALQLGGCAAHPPSLPAGLQAELVQLRGDIAPGRVQLHLENDTGREVVLTAATLSSSAFAHTATWDSTGSQELGAGRTVNIPVPLPRLVCTETPSVNLVATMDDGSGAREVSTELADPLGVLARLVEEQCAREGTEAITHVEAVAVSPQLDGTAVLSIEIDPEADASGTVQLVGLRSTPLLRFPGEEEWPLNLAVDSSDSTQIVDIVVEPRRCDPHAIAEDKVGTLFTLVVEVDGEELFYTLPLDDALRGELLSFTATACGLT